MKLIFRGRSGAPLLSTAPEWGRGINQSVNLFTDSVRSLPGIVCQRRNSLRREICCNKQWWAAVAWNFGSNDMTAAMLFVPTKVNNINTNEMSDQTGKKGVRFLPWIQLNCISLCGSDSAELHIPLRIEWGSTNYKMWQNLWDLVLEFDLICRGYITVRNISSVATEFDCSVPKECVVKKRLTTGTVTSERRLKVDQVLTPEIWQIDQNGCIIWDDYSLTLKRVRRFVVP